MGHTVLSQRIVIDIILKELKDYGKSLRKDDYIIYEQLLKKTFKHISNISYTSSINVWALILLSIILEQEKKIKEIEDERIFNGRLQIQEPSGAMDKNTL